jgi:hypothetical protein
MIITAIFVIALAWRIAKGINFDPSTSSVLSHKSVFKKSAIEIVIPRKVEVVPDGTTVDLIDYLRERREEQQKGKVQKVVFNTIPNSKPSHLYLN